MTIQENTRNTILGRSEDAPAGLDQAVRRHVLAGDIAMLTTMSDEGFLHSRPMGVHQVDEDGCLYFFSRDPSFKTSDIRGSSRVNLSFQSVPRMRFASLSGTAQVSHDAQLLRELWEEELREWYPQGLDDPGLAVLKVYPDIFDLWDGMMHTHAERVT